ncbi:GlxA family transcriptional regulator [Peristeroidobacter agariperforans]|uniref:GlxA family transcriptional regulator n=1 Tax=Peristeroidobacter agariperforans TaxID=268404 RepID=UPI00101CC1BC|nr:helix-turn-helix domain-containing protein [Peristeroidobacter agariperforans]
MSRTNSEIRIAVLGYDRCSAWITAGLLELFAVAGIAGRQSGRNGVHFRCEVVSTTRRPVRASHGVRLTPAPLRRHYEAVIVPPVWVESVSELVQRVEQLHSLHALLRTLASRSDITASACSGAAILASAGLLAQRRATTCWWLASWFAHTFPDIDLEPDRLVMIDRDRWTAAAGSAYIHLGLALVQRFAGSRVATATARLLLVERRRGSQSPFMNRLDNAVQTDDAIVGRALRLFETNATRRTTLGMLCKDLNVSERTLSRRFHAVLGMSPLTYIQSLRISRARTLLEETSSPLDAIVEQCGYEDISSFRKLFTRHVGMTPREYRSRFGGSTSGSQQ